MTGSARALGILIVLSVASALIVAGLTLSQAAPIYSGGMYAGAVLILAGGALVARLWQVQRAAILRHHR